MTTIPNIPDSVSSRQAVASIRGYAYQLYATADAWLQLGDREILLVEVAEDFAIVANEAIVAVQVKDDPSRKATLRAQGVVTAINNFWAIKEANPNISVNCVYLTTTRIGREKGFWFPDDRPGIEHWGIAARSHCDLEPIRSALSKMTINKHLKAWIETAESEELRNNLLKRIKWICGAPNIYDRATQLVHAIRSRRGFWLTHTDARRVFDAMIARLIRVAAGIDNRQLSADELDNLIEQASAVSVSAEQLRKLMARSTESAYRPPLHLMEHDGNREQLFFFAASNRIPLFGRDRELRKLHDWLDSEPSFSWTLITGPGGAGKSRIALEVSLIARSQGWHAGFLPRSSKYSDPSRFLKFAPEQPTLLVLDDAADGESRTGEIIRILIERTMAGDLPAKVRIILLERTGTGSPWYSNLVWTYNSMMSGYSAQLGDSDFLRLSPLSWQSINSILKHVAGEHVPTHEAKTQAEIGALDPEGRPLFAALDHMFA